jgi:hypothetical protein
MMKKIIAASAVVLGLAAGAAQAQTPTPQPKLIAPTGVGGCIYRSLPDAVSRDAITAILSHTSIAKVLREPVAAIAPKCTSQPFSDSSPDPAVVGSVMSVYSRVVAAFTLGNQLQLPERQLYDAWAAATPEEKAPFFASAESFLQSGVTFAAAKPEAAAPFVQRLGIGAKAQGPTVPQLVHMYYSAMALNELAEASLAARGASPTRNK